MSRYKLFVTECEILVVGGEAMVAQRWRLLSAVEPDVVVVRAPVEDLPEIVRAARFVLARRSDGEIQAIGDESSLGDLPEGTRLFVSAWREQRINKPDRVGEEQPWDAAGFEPPDRPES